MYRNEAFGFDYKDRNEYMDKGFNIWYYNIKFYHSFGKIKKYQEFDSGYINIENCTLTLIDANDHTTVVNFFAVPSSK